MLEIDNSICFQVRTESTGTAHKITTSLYRKFPINLLRRPMCHLRRQPLDGVVVINVALFSKYQDNEQTDRFIYLTIVVQYFKKWL